MTDKPTSLINAPAGLFTQDDVGRILYIDPRPWYLRLWHFVWFKIFRRKKSTRGAFVITGVQERGMILTLDSTKGRKDGDRFTPA